MPTCSDLARLLRTYTLKAYCDRERAGHEGLVTSLAALASATAAADARPDRQGRAEREDTEADAAVTRAPELEPGRLTSARQPHHEDRAVTWIPCGVSVEWMYFPGER